MKRTAVFIAMLMASALFATEPIVQDIKAAAGSGTKIIVTWKNPKGTDTEIKKLQVYRTAMPVYSYSQLDGLEPVAELSPKASRFTDRVQTYQDYYYTVIAFTDHPCDLILVSMNATTRGVHLKEPETGARAPQKAEEERLYTNGTLRETPLPFLNYLDRQADEKTISDKAAETARQFTAEERQEKRADISPYFFEEDLISPDGGDDYILFEILKNYFIREDYAQSISQLTRLTETNISQSVQNRAYFYIAEAQYFTGDYQNSVRSFLKVSKEFPDETKIWLNLALDSIQLPNQ